MNNPKTKPKTIPAVPSKPIKKRVMVKNFYPKKHKKIPATPNKAVKTYLFDLMNSQIYETSNFGQASFDVVKTV